jgi:peptidoglycan/xylan/chitin deacetylase (PgdA/CDA1 family)
MDDVTWQVIPRPHVDDNILIALREHGNLKAALFAVGQNVDNERGRAILDAWNREGHMLGNHTWSHKGYNSVETAWFEQDLLRNEALLKEWANFRKFFRFPALKEGKTAEKRDEMRTFLAEHEYRNGHVTIDASDWYYDLRLRERLKAESAFDVNRYREPYLNHLWDRALYYDGLAHKVLGHGIPHTILIHYNFINSLFLGDALSMFQTRGWNLVSAAEAYQNPVFLQQPRIAPAGESLIWALAKETGKFDDTLRYPGEDDVYEKPVLDRLGL